MGEKIFEQSIKEQLYYARRFNMHSIIFKLRMVPLAIVTVIALIMLGLRFKYCEGAVQYAVLAAAVIIILLAAVRLAALWLDDLMPKCVTEKSYYSVEDDGLRYYSLVVREDGSRVEEETFFDYDYMVDIDLEPLSNILSVEGRVRIIEDNQQRYVFNRRRFTFIYGFDNMKEEIRFMQEMYEIQNRVHKARSK